MVFAHKRVLRSFNETLVASNGFGDSTLAQLRLQRVHGEDTVKRLRKQKSILATEQEKRSEWSKPTLHHQHPDGLTLTPLHCSNSLHSNFHPRSRHSHHPGRRVFGLFGNVDERTRRRRRWRRGKLVETRLVRR